MAASDRRLRIILALAVTSALTVDCARERSDLALDNPAARATLFAALTPTKLTNCTLKRYGDADDGGYLMCENLMGDAQAAYSYGIDARDEWGCDVSRQLATAVHEYDCFNLKRPACERGTFRFHEECIGNQQTTIERRAYDTLANQIARNGDAGKHLIVKLDVEGSEWASLLATPDSVLDTIDQLVIEFHGAGGSELVETVEKLKRHFFVVHFHANNFACDPRLAPFTSWANEVLLVNRRIGIPDPSRGVPTLPDPLDAPNSGASDRDCQPVF